MVAWLRPRLALIGATRRAQLSQIQEAGVSSRTGLAWEAWSLFAIYNSFDTLMQAIMVAILSPIPKSPPLIFHKVIMQNFPLLSTKVDFMKDVVFSCILLHSGFLFLGIFSIVHLFILVTRQLTMQGLRLESREEFFALLKPQVQTKMQTQELGAFENIKMRFKLFCAEQATPIKLETSLYEDVPQAAMQVRSAALLTSEAVMSLAPRSNTRSTFGHIRDHVQTHALQKWSLPHSDHGEVRLVTHTHTHSCIATLAQTNRVSEPLQRNPKHARVCFATGLQRLIRSIRCASQSGTLQSLGLTCWAPYRASVC